MRASTSRPNRKSLKATISEDTGLGRFAQNDTQTKGETGRYVGPWIRCAYHKKPRLKNQIALRRN